MSSTAEFRHVKTICGINPKECHLCWKIVEKESDMYRESEKQLNNYKAYLSNKIIEDCKNSKGRNVRLCFNCHDSLKKLATVVRDLDCAEKELRQVVISFNYYILHLRNEGNEQSKIENESQDHEQVDSDFNDAALNSDFSEGENFTNLSENHNLKNSENQGEERLTSCNPIDNPPEIKLEKEDSVMDLVDHEEIVNSDPSSSSRKLFDKEIRIILPKISQDATSVLKIKRRKTKKSAADPCKSAEPESTNGRTRKRLKSRRSEMEKQISSHSKSKPYKCYRCTMRFQFPHLLTAHLKTHKKTLQKKEGFIFPCRGCGEKFNYVYKLRMHLQKEHPEIVDETHSYPYECQKCGRKFRFQHICQQHERKHDGQTAEEIEREKSARHTCSVCKKVFQRNQNLLRHMLIHTKQNSYKCENCDRCFPDKQQLLVHTKIHIKDFNFPCDRCEQKFKIPYDLKKHLKKHQKEDFLKENDKGTHFQCSICDQSFDKNQSSYFADHMFFHLNENPFKCKLCEKCFPTKVFLNDHYEEEHKDGFQCQICEKTFKSFPYLKKHLKLVHAEGKSFMCDLCGASFKTDVYLREHLARHQSRTLNCDHCIKKFTTRKQLRHHIRTIHESGNNVTCEFCGKSFLFSKIERHKERYHPTDKLACKRCGKKFESESKLEAHARKHTGETSFECPVCGKTYSQKCNLKVHMQCHTGEKPFKCHGCGNRYPRKYNLGVHIPRCKMLAAKQDLINL